MALKTILKLFSIWLVLLAWSSGTGAAGTVHRFKVTNGSCELLQREGASWKKAPNGVVPQGTSFIGREYPSAVVFSKNRMIYSIPLSCVREVKTSSGHASRWSISIAAISWTEHPTLTSPTSGSYSMTASPLGVCVGGSAEWSLSSAWNAKGSACFIYATTDLGVTQGLPAPTTISYSAHSERVIGFMATPSLVWKSPKTGVNVGIELPFLYQQASWPAPGGDFQVSGGSSLNVGIALAPSYSFGRGFVTTELGLLNFTSDFLWSLGLGYRL